MRHTKTIVLAGALAMLASALTPAAAQNRYDGRELNDKFMIRVGGFNQNDTDTTIRIDSSVGIGTILDLEDTLNVQSSSTVVRIDGHWRFSERNRAEWSLYNIKRDGTTTTLEQIEIGDSVFPVGATIFSEWDFEILKGSWAWSFINVEKYEFYVGAGLNISNAGLTFSAQDVTGEIRYDGDGLIPLPTFTFGGRFKITRKLALNFRTEFFRLEIGDFKGSLQDTYILLDYDITDHFGIGGGLNTFNFDLEMTQDELTGSIESSYNGVLFYLKAFF